jgi:predicted amidohydrolase
MRKVTVATVQMHPRLGDVEGNLGRMSDFVAQVCGEQPVDLIVFPELATTGYECGVRFADLAERVPGPAVNLMAGRAKEYGVHVVFGMVSKAKVESIIYDSAVMVDPGGELVEHYQKVHLRGEEQLAFRPGYRYRVLEASFGQVGVMVGWDLAFPEVARSLVLDGAELLCVLANWETPHAADWHTYNLARAYENACFVAGANRVGEEYTYSFFGRSMIIGPRGALHATLDEEVEGYALASIDLDEVRTYREEFQFFQCRRPHTYRSVVRRY